MRKPFLLLGTPVDIDNFTATLDRLESMVIDGRTSGMSYQVATINTDFVVNGWQDASLLRILQESDVATADGMPVVWSARLLGIPMEERVAGADLVPALAKRAAEKGFSTYFYGGRPGVAERAAEILQQRFPGLRVVGCQSPPFAPVDQTGPEQLQDIRDAEPDILFVALGNPKQERWIHLYREQLRVPLMMGVGGTLDFIAGERRRAPRWMHGLGLEWLFRLLQEPGRLWRRYLVDMVIFSLAFIRQWLVLSPQLNKQGKSASFGWRPMEQAALIQIAGKAGWRDGNALQVVLGEALNYSSRLFIDLSRLVSLDSAILGLLVEEAKQAQREGGHVTLVHTPKRILAALTFIRVETFFEHADFIPVDSGMALGNQDVSVVAF